MTLRTRPAPELLTFKNWYTSTTAALDGSGFPSGTYSDFQTSNFGTKAASGVVGVKSFDLTVTVAKARSWIIDARATAALLEHERLHFIIAFCVDLHEDVHSSTALSSADLTRDVTQLIKKAAVRTQKISDDYDRDTANGTRAAQQSVWSARIRSWQSTGFKEW